MVCAVFGTKLATINSDPWSPKAGACLKLNKFGRERVPFEVGINSGKMYPIFDSHT
jgi:hypothetical protein